MAENSPVKVPDVDMSSHENGAGAIPQMAPPPIPPMMIPADAKISGRDAKVTMSVPMSQILGGYAHAELPRPPLRGQVSGIQFLAELANSAEGNDVTLHVYRTGPATWEGQILPTNCVERITPPLPYPDLSERIRQIHGGGEYQIVVMAENGQCVKKIPLRLDTITDPPKFTQNVFAQGQQNGNGNRPMYTPGTSMAARTFQNAAVISEDEEVVEVRKKERKLAAEMSLKDKEREAAKKERLAKQEEEAEREREARRQTGPADAMQLELRRITEANDKRFEMLMTQMQAQMTAMIQVATKPQDTGAMTSIMALMMKSMETQSNTLVALITAGAKKDTGNSELTDAMKMIQEANQRMFEMSLKASTGQNPRYDKLIDTIITSSLSQKSDSVKEALSLMDHGRKQAMEMIEMREEMRQEDDDGVGYDPEMGVGANLVNIVVKGFQAILKGSGGMGALTNLLGMLGKQNSSEVTDRDLHSLAQRMENRGMKALPVSGQFNPTYQPPYAQQAQREQVMAARVQPLPVIPPAPVQVQAPAQRRAPVNNIPRHPAIAEVYEDSSIQQQAPAQVQAQPVVMPQQEEMMEEDTGSVNEYVTEAMRVCISDLKAARRAHEWVDYAYDKWPKSLLDRFVQTANDSERLNLIQIYCSPEVFAEVQSLVLDERQPQNYPNFVSALNQLVQEHTSPAQV